MVSVIVKAALLLYLLHLVAHVTSQSSCIPDYFQYRQHEKWHEIIGRIEIRQPPKGVALDISATLSIPVELPTRYFGRIELAQSNEESVEAVEQGKTLKYNLYFPLRQPVAQLTSLWFNNRTVCTGPRATGQTITYIVLNHTLYPAGIAPIPVDEVIPPQTKLDDVPLPPVSTAPTVRQIVTPASTAEPKPITGTDQSVQECGRSTVMKEKVNQLVAEGEKTLAGQWPWLVAIYKFQTARAQEREFQCGGTLVTNTHVITAANCLYMNNEILPPETFLVSVGRYRLHDWKERWAEDNELSDHRIHPYYHTERDNVTLFSADYDLAILILKKSVKYTEMIQPICLWSGKIKLDYVVGETGFVVGWGRDELGNRYLEEPQQTVSAIASQEDCLWSHERFRLTTSQRTFCAGTRTGNGTCISHSGSGFVIYNKDTDRHYLRGVVSRSLKDPNSLSCNLTNYDVYVDVAKYLVWIGKQISL